MDRFVKYDSICYNSMIILSKYFKDKKFIDIGGLDLKQERDLFLLNIALIYGNLAKKQIRISYNLFERSKINKIFGSKNFNSNKIQFIKEKKCINKEEILGDIEKFISLNEEFKNIKVAEIYREYYKNEI